MKGLKAVSSSAGGGYNPQYITTGLNIYQNRCTINDGGYYISGDIVYVDITVTSNTSWTGWELFIYGWPQAAPTPSSSITPLTPIFNKEQLYQNTIASGFLTCLRAGGDDVSISVGESLHFIGSYQMKTN